MLIFVLFITTHLLRHYNPTSICPFLACPALHSNATPLESPPSPVLPLMVVCPPGVPVPSRDLISARSVRSWGVLCEGPPPLAAGHPRTRAEAQIIPGGTRPRASGVAVVSRVTGGLPGIKPEADLKVSFPWFFEGKVKRGHAESSISRSNQSLNSGTLLTNLPRVSKESKRSEIPFVMFSQTKSERNSLSFIAEEDFAKSPAEEIRDMSHSV
ncbi:hypothetical protein RRG08_037405 [Elysia crispata]|uniref:Uncharacterized protein n=1 Tax=Elysia crispata TaxID=231223 RepID=A0AAE1AG95_9GAST|nr:hypothetical protein RRG08_037405 [Elysia crispata]